MDAVFFARSHVPHDVRALDGVDLTVRAGEICAIVGPNGAGKATLFRILVGLTTATEEGWTGVLGLDVERDFGGHPPSIGRMDAVGGDRSLLMRATCRENLQMHGRLQGMRKRELATRISESLAAVDLVPRADSVVASLSAGMKARLRLARALLPGPRALILDEPTGAVDPIAARRLLNLIIELVEREQLAVLISSHRLEEIEALQSKALLLDKGQVKYSGDLAELRRRWDAPQVELVFDSAAAARSAVSRMVGLDTELSTDDGRPTVRCLLPAGLHIGDLLGRLQDVLPSVLHVRGGAHAATMTSSPVVYAPQPSHVEDRTDVAVGEPSSVNGLSDRPSLAAVRRRGLIRKVVDTVGGYLRIDLVEERMFPATTILRYLAVIFPVLLYYFQSAFFQMGDQTFLLILIGASITAGLQDALTGLTSRMQFAQERGTLETYLVEPIPWALIPIAMNIWRSITGAAVACLMVGVGWLLGAPVVGSAIPAALGILFLGIVACNAIGTLAASFLILFKRGDPIITFCHGLAAGVLGGALFPPSVLPEWLRWASYLVPHTYVIGAERQLLMASPPAGDPSPPRQRGDSGRVLCCRHHGRGDLVRPLAAAGPSARHPEVRDHGTVRPG